MLKVKQLLSAPVDSRLFIELSFEIRQKSRFKARLSDDTLVGVFLPRGHILRQGDCLQAEDGRIIQVHAEDERVSAAYADNPLLLAKACYHLGNRHVALQIDANRLSYLPDHVLDDMLIGLGLQVKQESAPFEPENGAYARHSHSHSRQQPAVHAHSHD